MLLEKDDQAWLHLISPVQSVPALKSQHKAISIVHLVNYIDLSEAVEEDWTTATFACGSAQYVLHSVVKLARNSHAHSSRIARTTIRDIDRTMQCNHFLYCARRNYSCRCPTSKESAHSSIYSRTWCQAYLKTIPYGHRMMLEQLVGNRVGPRFITHNFTKDRGQGGCGLYLYCSSKLVILWTTIFRD